MNHLEQAKEQMNLVDGKDNIEDMRRAYLANGYALIAIAEQLEEINHKTKGQYAMPEGCVMCGEYLNEEDK